MNCPYLYGNVIPQAYKLDVNKPNQPIVEVSRTQSKLSKTQFKQGAE
jgi:hypothetical protein